MRRGAGELQCRWVQGGWLALGRPGRQGTAAGASTDGACGPSGEADADGIGGRGVGGRWAKRGQQGAATGAGELQRGRRQHRATGQAERRPRL